MASGNSKQLYFYNDFMPYSYWLMLPNFKIEFLYPFLNKTALLRYNSHTIKFTYLKSTSQWFSYSCRVVNITHSNFSIYFSNNKDFLYWDAWFLIFISQYTFFFLFTHILRLFSDEKSRAAGEWFSPGVNLTMIYVKILLQLNWWMISS